MRIECTLINYFGGGGGCGCGEATHSYSHGHGHGESAYGDQNQSYFASSYLQGVDPSFSMAQQYAPSMPTPAAQYGAPMAPHLQQHMSHPHPPPPVTGSAAI